MWVVRGGRRRVVGAAPQVPAIGGWPSQLCQRGHQPQHVRGAAAQQPGARHVHSMCKVTVALGTWEEWGRCRVVVWRLGQGDNWHVAQWEDGVWVGLLRSRFVGWGTALGTLWEANTMILREDMSRCKGPQTTVRHWGARAGLSPTMSVQTIHSEHHMLTRPPFSPTAAFWLCGAQVALPPPSPGAALLHHSHGHMPPLPRPPSASLSRSSLGFNPMDDADSQHPGTPGSMASGATWDLPGPHTS